MTHWTDEALDDDANDQLDRRRFADRVAELIKRAADEDGSSVFGLISPWGSGKTTLVNFVVNRVGEPWRVVHFTPWAASSIDGLMAEFFAVIVSTLPPQSDARVKMLGYAKFVLPALGAIPVIGQAAKDTGGAVLDRLEQSKPWNEQFQEASDQLSKLQTPVLVVADDIDRLEADELAAFLKAIRLLGRFPGVHYLLAYDQDTLVDVLQGTGVAGDDSQRALAYLEKIVQYPLAVPPARRVHLERMLDSGLADALKASGHQMDTEAAQRFALAYEDLLAQNMTTVRTIQRFLAQARAYLPLLEPGEIDVVDLLLLIHLRMHFPSLYAELPGWRAELTGRFDPGRTQDSDRQEEGWTGRIRSTDVPQRFITPVKNVLQGMFPAMGGATIYRRAKNRGVHDPDYFGRYFALGISDDDIADATVAQALREAADGVDGSALSAFESVVRGSNEELARLGIRKAIRLTDGLDESRILPLVKYVAGLVEMLPDRGNVIFSVSDSGVAWFARLLIDLPAIPDKADIDVLVGGAGTGRFAQAIRLALRDQTSRAGDRPVHAIVTHFLEHAHRKIMGNIAAGDNAANEPIPTLVEILELAGAAGSLTGEITAGLNSGRWNIDDVAARFVSIGWVIGVPERPEIMNFNVDHLLIVLPEASEYVAALPPDEAGGVIDEYDVSWPNRRRVARQGLRSLTAKTAESS